MSVNTQNRVFSYGQALVGAIETARALAGRIAAKVERGKDLREDIAVLSGVVEDIALSNSNANEPGMDFGDAFKDAQRVVAGAKKDMSRIDSALEEGQGFNPQEMRFAVGQLNTYSGFLSRLPVYQKAYFAKHPPAES